MTLNERINTRAIRARVEKIKGYGGLGFTGAIYGPLKEEAIKNGGSNTFAFKKTKSLEGVLADWAFNSVPPINGYKK